MDMKIRLGQHLVAGFQGTSMTEEFIRRVKSHKIGNVILFEYNVASKEQLSKLCGDIRALIEGETGITPFITIDQEGGAVSRLKEDCAVFPSAMAVAATGGERYAYRCGRVTGEELRAMGVNFDLAPVMDVNSNPSNPVIGVRSYGDTPDQVSRFGTAMLRGLGDAGVLSCVKHFPGHGDTAVDSHLGLPTVDKSLEELERCELVPFRAAIKAGVPAVMTTHILFPRLEPDGVPATMSRRIITGLLRERMGFGGLVISDCMMMGAIAKYYGTVEGCLAAVRAGVDVVFTSHSADLAAQVIDELQARLERGELDARELEESGRRIAQAKAALPSGGDGLDSVGSAAHRAESESITRMAITLGHDAPFRLGDRPLFMGCYRFRPTMVSSPEDTSLSFAGEMQKLLGGEGVATPQDPTDGEIMELMMRCPGHSSIVVGTYNGALRPGQLRLVRRAAEMGLPVACVALRNPYDLADLPDNVYALAAYDYDARTLPAVADVLLGRLKPMGTLPVKIK